MGAVALCPRGFAEVPRGRGIDEELLCGLSWRSEFEVWDEIYSPGIEAGTEC